MYLREICMSHMIFWDLFPEPLDYQDTMMMGADFYDTEKEVADMLRNGKIPLGVGENSRISNCIIDKNARIGKNVVIANTDVRFRSCHYCWDLSALPKGFWFWCSTLFPVEVLQMKCGIWLDWLQNVQEATRPELGFYIKTGVTVIEKNGIIKDGTVI